MSKRYIRHIGLIGLVGLIISGGVAAAQYPGTVMVDPNTGKLLKPLNFFEVNGITGGGGGTTTPSGPRVFILPVPFGYAASDFVIKVINPTTGAALFEYTSNPQLDDPCITANNGVPFAPDKVEVWSGSFTPSGVPWVKPANQSIAVMTGGAGASSVRVTVSQTFPANSRVICAFATASSWIKHNGQTAVWTLD